MGADSAHSFHVYDQAVIQSRPSDLTLISRHLQGLAQQASQRLDKDGIARNRRRYAFSIDIRHKGQINEVEVLLPEVGQDGLLGSLAFSSLHERFYARYEQLYGRGSSYRDARLELVTLRLRASAATPRPQLHEAPVLKRAIPQRARRPAREIFWADLKRTRETPIFDGAMLLPGNRIQGPAVVETTDTTVVLHPKRTLTVDAFGNFEITFPQSFAA